MLLKQLDDHSFALWCPACEDIHVLGEEWEFKGTLEKPSFHPSVYRWEPEYVCHFFVNQGQLLFLGDCTHEYADMTLRMPHLPTWFTLEDSEITETLESEAEDGFYYPEDPSEEDEFTDSSLETAGNDPFWTEID